MRRWRPPVIVTVAAMAALTALTADAAARQARPAPPIEATAPREAGEPIMAIVSIKSQQVTFYDADGWILRAPVSTGIAGRACLATASAVSAVSAAIAASVTMAGGPKRRIAPVGCPVANRFTMPCPG